jgi:hypothetical protein
VAGETTADYLNADGSERDFCYLSDPRNPRLKEKKFQVFLKCLPSKILVRGSKSTNGQHDMNTDASDLLALSAAFGPNLFALLTEPPVAVAAEGLAIGVLRQAVHDLRKFRSATRGVERDHYLDAYSWIMADDSFWPYSFLNACKLLHLSAEAIRGEVLADLSLGWFGHWLKLTRRLARSFPGSCIRVLRMSRDAKNTRDSFNSPRPSIWFVASIEDRVL